MNAGLKAQRRSALAALDAVAGWCYESFMTLAEIRDRYKGKWVLIEYRELDRDLEVVDGDVVAVADSKEQIYAKQLTIEGKNLAIEYCGEWPTDLAVMFWLPVTR